MDLDWDSCLMDDLWRFWQNKWAMGLDICVYSCSEDTQISRECRCLMIRKKLYTIID